MTNIGLAILIKGLRYYNAPINVNPVGGGGGGVGEKGWGFAKFKIFL